MDNAKKRVIELRTDGAKAFLIAGEDGRRVLVDAGMGADGKALRRELGRNGVDPADIRLIVATHAHPDHVGALAVAAEMSGAPVLCLSAAVPYLRTGTNSPIVPRSAAGRFIVRISPEWKTRPVEPTHVFEDEFDLSPFGVRGKAVAAPGHTADSLAIVLETGEAIIGDLARGRGKKLSWGLFYEDRAACVRSVRRVLSLGARACFFSHGGSSSAADLAAFVEGED